MKLEKHLIGTLILAGGLTACGGIGEGNGPKSIEIRMDGNSEQGEAFACLASTPQAVLTFDNDTAADFARRAVWSSSDEAILKISDGSIEAGDGSFFVNGALLPIAAGEADISVEYLGFTDTLHVVVSPIKIELTPVERTLVQGESVKLTATGILSGADESTSLDMSVLGNWSVSGQAGGDAVSSVSATGLLVAQDNVSGTDTVSYSIDFCGLEKSVDVSIVDQTLESIRLVSALDTSSVVSEVVLPPDASYATRVIGKYNGGYEADLTARSVFTAADLDIAFVSLRGVGVVTSNSAAQAGQATSFTVSVDPDTSVADDELTIADVPVRIADVSLDADSLSISPTDSLMINGSALQFSASGTFVGNDGPLVWDLSRDVTWFSSNPEVLLVSNSNGVRGLAISSGDTADIGTLQVSAVRSTDGPETAPLASVTVGATQADEALLQVVGLTVQADATSLSRGDSLVLRAIADIANDTLSGTQDISSFVVWSSSDESLAVVSNASSSRGTVRVVSDLVDQSVTLTVTYRDADQAAAITKDFVLSVNPSPSAQ